MNYQDKIITSIASLSTKQANPITEYSENFNTEQLAELCVFNYCYSWLYILDEDLISLTDENIRRFQLACNLVTNKITSNTIDPIEFLDMFREQMDIERKYREQKESCHQSSSSAGTGPPPAMRSAAKIRIRSPPMASPRKRMPAGIPAPAIGTSHSSSVRRAP